MYRNRTRTRAKQSAGAKEKVWDFQSSFLFFIPAIPVDDPDHFRISSSIGQFPAVVIGMLTFSSHFFTFDIIYIHQLLGLFLIG